MIIPALKLIFLLCLVRNLIMFVLHFADKMEKAKSGKPIPSPKNKKLNMFVRGFWIMAALAKRAARKAGLQGITIPPKKNP